MITKVVMPQMSLTMKHGTVTDWLKLPGDAVRKGEAICIIEGDKATVEVESPADGVLKMIVAKEGEEFPVKEAMAFIGDPGDVVELDPEPEKQARASAEMGKPAPAESVPVVADGGRVLATPVARRLAKEMNIDLSQIAGSGKDGSITKEDVEAYASGEASPSLAYLDGARELTGIEKIVAERMAESNREIPHFHLSVSFDISEANRLRNELNSTKDAGNKISLTDIVAWAASHELPKHAALNSSFNDNQVIEHADVNIGVAVDTSDGLLVVVIKQAATKSIGQIAEQRHSLTQRALDGQQTVDDVSGATFTITNLGMFGVEAFDPIIPPGQVAILSIGTLKHALDMDSDGVVRSFEQISMTLGCDHRAVDGVAGAKFLADLRQRMTQPSAMFE